MSAPLARPAPPAGWFVVAPSAAVQARPVGVTVHEVPLVLFRAAGGVVAALVDRCPHRNVPLSLGAVRGGALECPYHGWRFGPGGDCVAVPGLVDEAVGAPSRCATAWSAREAQGFVWVHAPGFVSSESFVFPHQGEPGYHHVRAELEADASVHAVAENALDVPHTAFLHAGLFRGPDKKHVLDVVVRRDATSCEAHFHGEPVPRGLVGRLLAPQGGVVEHVDRFLLPGVAQVDYRLGRWHVVTTSFLTPVAPTRTKLFSVVSFRLPLPGWLVALFVGPIARHIFRQDARLLAAQTKQLARFGGEAFVSTEIDVLGPHIARLLAGTAPAQAHEHRVRLKT